MRARNRCTLCIHRTLTDLAMMLRTGKAGWLRFSSGACSNFHFQLHRVQMIPGTSPAVGRTKNWHTRSICRNTDHMGHFIVPMQTGGGISVSQYNTLEANVAVTTSYDVQDWNFSRAILPTVPAIGIHNPAKEITLKWSSACWLYLRPSAQATTPLGQWYHSKVRN